MHAHATSRRFRSTLPDAPAGAISTGFRTGTWKYGKAELPEEIEPLHRTVLAALHHAAEVDEGVGITLLPERPGRASVHMSYAELRDRALRMAEGLRGLGVERGDRVILVLPTSLDFVAAFFGIELLGAVPVPAYPPAGLRIEAGLARLNHVARQSEARLCVTWDLVLPLLGELARGAPRLSAVVTVDSLVAAEPVRTQHEAAPADHAFVQYTSGSTGNPKGVVLSHDNLVCNIHSIGQALEVNRSDLTVSWCPLYHDMGLIGGLLFSIYWRLPLVLLSPQAFLARPHRWLQAIHEHRGTLSPAPNFGYALAVRKVTPEQRDGLDLSCWRVALNGAEPVNVQTVRTFQETYAPYGFAPEAFLPVYGLAEASLAAAFPDPGRPIRWQTVDREALANGTAIPSTEEGAMKVVSVGAAVPGQYLMVLDEHGAALDEGEVGHIVVAGRSVMVGYLLDPEATGQVLDGDALWTGDLGYLSGGELYVTGRAKDLIIVRGKNYYAEDLEAAIERVPGVRGGGCVALGIYDEAAATDHIVVVAETRLTGGEERRALAESIYEALNEACGVLADDVAVVEPGTLPRTSSGKRQRSRTRALYLNGEIRLRHQSKLRLGVLYLRSQVGYLTMGLRRWWGGAA